MNSVPDIRRERIIILPEMTKSEIKEKYGLSTKRAREALNKGFFVRNYSKRQVIIDPTNFDPAVSYSTAKRVYFKNFSPVHHRHRGKAGHSIPIADVV